MLTKGRCLAGPQGLRPLPRMPHRRVPKSGGGDNRRFSLSSSMVHTPASSAACLRRAAQSAAPQSRACVLRRQQAQSHGVPSAFVSLSGVTAMLSAAVRKA